MKIENGWTGLSDEMVHAQFGDLRLSKRLAKLVDALSERSSESFPAVLGEAGLEGGYRFWNNPRVHSDEILEPHIVATAERAAQEPLVRVLHDSTQFSFKGQCLRPGLGRLRRRDQGFFAHASLAVRPGEDREALGVVALKTWVRDQAPKAKRRRRKGKGNADRESLRWLEQARLAEARLSESKHVVHIMDREADSFELIHGLGDFVIRAMHDRVVQLPSEIKVGGRQRLKQALSHAAWFTTREVILSPRAKSTFPIEQKIHPARDGRIAKLAISAMAVRIHRTEYVDPGLPEWIDVNVVSVVEVDAPPGVAAVEWTLLSNLPISTAQQVEAIVDHYRARWLIEEFFKALKTGCNYEQRQLESLHALLNALATFIPIAWRLLLLRTHARHHKDLPATAVLTNTQIEVLRTLSSKPLSAKPTAREALLEVARLGGHLKRNGEPGWQVLWKGLRDLMMMEQGWLAARASPTRK